MNQENVGKFIAELRKEKNMTQQELAEKLNVTDRAISNWERGRRLPDISLLKELSNFFEVTIDEVISGRKINKNEKNKLLEENIIRIYTTRKTIKIIQILTQILICGGILITITFTSLANGLSKKIITFCIGLFVWIFGMIINILLGKIYNQFNNK